MFGGNVLRLGSLFGIRIGVDPTWFLVFFLVTYSLAQGFHAEHADWSEVIVWLAAATASLSFFASILLHELGHSITAILLGVRVRSITLFLFGGAAELASEPRRPLDEFLIAIAGPAVSALLGVAFLIVWLAAPGTGPLPVVSGWLGATNIGVALFNLLPGFPLDGGRVLRSILWALTDSLERATQWSGRVGVLLGRVFVALGIGIAILGQQWVYGLFVSFLGWFLLRAARATVLQSVLTGRLKAISVGRALEADLPRVDGWDTLEDVVREVPAPPGERLALVAEEGELVGVIGEQELSQVDEGKRAFHQARQVMTPLARLASIDPRASLLVALRTLEREGAGQLLVRRDGELVGVLTRERLRRVLHAP